MKKYPDIIIFCRRAIDWNRFRLSPRNPSNFNTVHPISKLVQAWEAANPAMPFVRYRQHLHRLAVQSWEATGGTVLMNWIAPDADNGVLNGMNLEVVRRASWVVPIDDDDWLSPEICKFLAARLWDHPQGEHAVAWKSMVIHIDPGAANAEPPRAVLNPGGKPPVILSCSYALGKAGIRSLTDQQLSLFLANHGPASEWMAKTPMEVSDRILGLHLRHRATAGAAANAHKDKGMRVMPFDVRFEWPKDGLWGVPLLYQLQQIHAPRND